MLRNTGNRLLNAEVHNSVLRIQRAVKKGPPQGAVAQLAKGTSSV